MKYIGFNNEQRNMAKCKYCGKPDAEFKWGDFKFCQSCDSRIFTVWEAEYMKKMYPGIEVYAKSKALDRVVDVEGRKRNLLLDYWGLHV